MGISTEKVLTAQSDANPISIETFCDACADRSNSK